MTEEEKQEQMNMLGQFEKMTLKLPNTGDDESESEESSDNDIEHHP